MPGLVIQSHRSPLPAPWLKDCIDSVQAWAAVQGFDYRWLGDELFDPVPARLLAKTRRQPVVATDLARLYQLERALAEGYAPVLWLDADVLVFAPQRLTLPAAGHGFGREFWLQRSESGAIKAYRRLHNAALLFYPADPVLPFYRFAAERLLERYAGDGMTPQLIGPKLVSALGSLAQFTALEAIVMLSPLVREALLSGDGRLVKRWWDGHQLAPAAVNLCSSLAGSDAVMSATIQAFRSDIDKLVHRVDRATDGAS